MDVVISTLVVNGARRVSIHFADGMAPCRRRATVQVWVRDGGSREEIHARAVRAARGFMALILQARPIEGGDIQ